MTTKLDDQTATRSVKRRRRVHIRARGLATLTGLSQTAEVVTIGRDQAVRLPPEYRFDEREVYIRRDTVTGDVILSRRSHSWEDFFALDATMEVPVDFMNDADRKQIGRTCDSPEDAKQSDAIPKKST